MFIQEFCGSWMDHPFWKAKFLLKTDADVLRVKASSITELWIDTSKGLDVASGGQSAEEVEAETEARLLAADAAPERIARVSLDEEVGRAAMLCERSKEAVMAMFSEVRMGAAIDVDNMQSIVESISDSVGRHPSALISLARLKNADEYTYMHSVAVCALMIALSRQLGMDDAQVRDAGAAGLLHDLGKMGVPDDVLNKPGKLTDIEFTVIKKHPELGAEFLRDGGQVNPVTLDVVLHHHEKVDGTGYPHGLKGDEISLFARMGAVCDVYDAITSDRPYKKGWGPAESIRKMAEWSKGHFDEAVFQAFVKSIGIYPTGSLVRLQSGRLGVVLEQNDNSLLTPTVKVFFSAKSKSQLMPEVIDLSKLIGREKIVGRESAEEWGFRNIEELWSGIPAKKT